MKWDPMLINNDKSEVVRYNNPLFPAYIVDSCLSISPFPDYAVPSHWHDDVEFLVILNGSVSFNINGTIVNIKKGDGIFLNARCLHYTFSPNHKDGIYLCFILHPSLLSSNQYFEEKFVKPFLQDSRYPFIPLKHSVLWSNEILELLKEIHSKKDEELAPFIVQKNFFRVMELLYENNRPSPFYKIKNKENLKLDTLKKMILFVQKHYAEKITLDEIAAAGACCKSKASALFKEFTKDSPVNFLIKYRLKKSCDLLFDTEQSLTEIALDCGFCTSSYFCELFKKFYEITPQEYRKRHK